VSAEVSLSEVQRNEEKLVERMWIKFSTGKTVTNSVCSDFFFTMIRPDRNFSHLNAFEVLDTIVNCDLPPGHENRRLLPRRKSQPLPTVEVEETPVEEITVESPVIPEGVE